MHFPSRCFNVETWEAGLPLWVRTGLVFIIPYHSTCCLSANFSRITMCEATIMLVTASYFFPCPRMIWALLTCYQNVSRTRIPGRLVIFYSITGTRGKSWLSRRRLTDRKSVDCATKVETWPFFHRAALTAQLIRSIVMVRSFNLHSAWLPLPAPNLKIIPISRHQASPPLFKLTFTH